MCVCARAPWIHCRGDKKKWAVLYAKVGAEPTLGARYALKSALAYERK